MIEKFLDNFNVTSKEDEFEEDYNKKARNLLKEISSLYKLFDLYGGITINKGLYRIHTFSSSLFWTNIVTEYFKKYKYKVYSFGFDWLGNHFVLKIANSGEKSNSIFLLDPATGKVYELPVDNIITFHNNELVNNKEEALIFDEFIEYSTQNDILLNFNQCIGYKIPLLAGGEDNFDNYEITDMEIYWELNYQLFNKTQNLPEGTLINKVDFTGNILKYGFF